MGNKRHKYKEQYEADDHEMHRTKAGLMAISDKVFETRNRRSVWTIPTRPYKGAHFAVFPPALVEPCILAGSRPGDTVMDPFFGSGTVAEVASLHGRNSVGCELNPAYVELATKRMEPTNSHCEVIAA